MQAYSIFFIIQPIPVFKPECVIFDARSAQNVHVVLTISQYSKKISKYSGCVNPADANLCIIEIIVLLFALLCQGNSIVSV